MESSRIFGGDSESRKAAFTSQLKRLRVNMGKTPFEGDERDAMFEELSFIPGELWPELVTAALDNWETWPRNFPKAIKSLWREWKSRQQDRIVKPESTECRECWSTGYLWARKLIDDLSTPLNPYHQTTMFLCAKCNNSGGIPLGTRRVTRIQLETEGYELEILGDNFEDPDDARRQFLALAGHIFKPMPSPPTPADLEQRRQEQKRALEAYLGEPDDELPF